MGYDVVSGVSAGSINAIGIAMFEKGQEKEAGVFLNTTWRTLTADKVYQEWSPLGIASGITSEKGLLDTTPLHEFLTSVITAPKRKVNISATNINTAEWNRFNETLPVPDLVEAMMCSDAVEIGYPFKNFQGGAYMDGGMVNNIDSVGGSERCLETAEPEDIIVDVIYCEIQELKVIDPSGFKTADIYRRVKDIKNYSHKLKAWDDAILAYPDVIFRHRI